MHKFAPELAYSSRKDFEPIHSVADALFSRIYRCENCFINYCRTTVFPLCASCVTRFVMLQALRCGRRMFRGYSLDLCVFQMGKKNVYAVIAMCWWNNNAVRLSGIVERWFHIYCRGDMMWPSKNILTELNPRLDHQLRRNGQFNRFNFKCKF